MASASGQDVAARSSADSSNWDDAVDAARQGCRESQAKLLEALRPYLLALAEKEVASDLRPKMAPSELVQETLLRAWTGMVNFQGHTRAELVAWLRTIFTHAAVDGARAYRNSARRCLARERSLDELERGTGFEKIPLTSGSSPSERAMVAEEQFRIEQTLRKLSPRHEQAIRLRSLLGLSFPEMGLALDCSADAARMLWVRAVEQFGRLMKDDDD